MRMHTASGRSRWPYVIGGSILVIALVGGVVYATTRPEPTPPAASTSNTSTPTPTPGGDTGAGDNEDDVAPTGCLGGPERTSAMVLAAQQQAKHTTYGAVEVATAFYRFLWQYPYPADVDSTTVSTSIMASDSPASYRDLVTAYAAAGNDLSRGTVAAGVPFHVSTTNGLWRVSEESTSDEVHVSLAAGYVVEGALSPTLTTVTGFVMVWEGDSWRIQQSIVPDQDKLAAGGNRYTGGC